MQRPKFEFHILLRANCFERFDTGAESKNYHI